MLNIIYKNKSVYVGDKLLMVNYSETVKKMEEEGLIECILIDNSDFFSLYYLNITAEFDKTHHELFFKIINEQQLPII